MENLSYSKQRVDSNRTHKSAVRTGAGRHATEWDCMVNKGFYFFQYGMGITNDPTHEATSLAAIQNRPGDKYNVIYSGSIPLRQQNPHLFNNHFGQADQIIINEDNNCSLFPNPIISESEILCNGTGNPTQLKISNAMGYDVSSDFIFDFENGRIKLKPKAVNNGLYILTYSNINGTPKNIYFTINN